MTRSIQSCLIIIFAVFAMLITVPAEAGKRSQTKQFRLVQSKYASSIRWNEFEMAWGYVDPDYRKEHPLNELENSRFKQIQVTGYDEKSQDILDDGRIEMRVEIRLVNRNTQTERIIIDTQIWRWDEKAKRWWLTTGLPDVTSPSL